MLRRFLFLINALMAHYTRKRKCHNVYSFAYLHVSICFVHWDSLFALESVLYYSLSRTDSFRYFGQLTEPPAGVCRQLHLTMNSLLNARRFLQKPRYREWFQTSLVISSLFLYLSVTPIRTIRASRRHTVLATLLVDLKRI